MNIPHDKFCVLPWVSLETSPIGTVRPCCLADDEIVDNAGKKFNLAHANFIGIQNSHYMRLLRQEFIDAKQPKTCRKCWDEELAGRTSKRMHTLDRLKHMLPDQEWTIDAKPLMFLDLKLGNICNLKCRICGSWSSSTYAVEEIAHDTSLNRKNSFHYTMLRQGRWPRENVQFWQELDRNLADIRYLEFTGGEPFMIEEHFDFLRELVASGHAGQIEIHYNTNGTIWPEKAENIWKHFKLIEIAFSIDDVEKRFEYQRSGAVWTQVCENIERFKQLRQRCTNIQLQVCCTVNIFNVFYLPAVADWIDHQGFDFVYWNIMHDAEYFSIRSLPDSAKIVIADHLRAALVPARTQREFDNVITFMRRGVSSDGNRMREEIKKVDHRRQQDFTIVAPELAEIINYEGP
jgi:MoaA/NifB/PqqE/SkfB family radical SAM enzyme